MGNIRHTFTSPLRHDHTCHLLYSTYSKYEEDWSSYPHTHYFTELFFVLSGSGSFLVEDETFPIAKHDLIVINANFWRGRPSRVVLLTAVRICPMK